MEFKIVQNWIGLCIYVRIRMCFTETSTVAR